MKINIKFMKKAAYKYLSDRSSEVLQNIKKNPNDGSWLKNYLGYDPYEEETDIQIEDFVLDYDDDYYKYAVSNGKRLYEALRDLPARVLYSPYFWAWINFEKAYRQAQQSLGLPNARRIEISWFPKRANRLSVVRGAMSREFVKVKMSVDYSLDDPYELTDCLFNNRTLYHNLAERSFCDNENFSHAILRVAKIFTDTNGRELSRDECNDLLKCGYDIGSVMLIDSLSSDEILEILIKKFGSKYPELF